MPSNPTRGFVSVGAAMNDALLQALAEREAQRRQAMLDELNRRELEARQKDRELARENQRLQIEALNAQRAATEQLRRQQTAESIAQQLRPGDELDEDTAETLRSGGYGPLVAAEPGTLAARHVVGFTPLGGAEGPSDVHEIESAGSAPRVSFRGTAAQRAEQEQKARLEAFLKNAPENVRQYLEAQIATGDKSLPVQLFQPDDTPIFRVNPRTGKTEQIGTAPKGAHFVTEPAPPAEADDTALTLSEAGLDAAALTYAKTGQLPAMGMGKSSAGLRTRIINRAAELFPDLDVASNKASYAADSGALSVVQKQRDAVGAFENTALKNLDVFLDAARDAGVVDTGSPWLNQPLRALASGASGSKELAAYNTARRTVIPEFAKILSNPSMSGVLSDSARHEIEEIVAGNATLAQIEGVARVLKQDAHNRRESLDAQIAEIKGRIKGSKPSEPAPPGAVEEWVRDPKTGKLRKR